MSLIQSDYERQSGVMQLTLNRSERHNALNNPLLFELECVLHEIEADSSARCILITGAGDQAFSSGADISEQTGGTSDDAYRNMRWEQQLFDRLPHMRQPTVAAINSFALDGGLALACDFRIASDTAQLGLPEVTLANLPGWGEHNGLARLIGASKAKLVTMMGNRLDAAQCLELGMITAVYPVTEFFVKARSFATAIAERLLQSLTAIKEIIDWGGGRSSSCCAVVGNSSAKGSATGVFFTT